MVAAFWQVAYTKCRVLGPLARALKCCLLLNTLSLLCEGRGGRQEVCASCAVMVLATTPNKFSSVLSLLLPKKRRERRGLFFFFWFAFLGVEKKRAFTGRKMKGGENSAETQLFSFTMFTHELFAPSKSFITASPRLRQMMFALRG